jgi:hypothetical protein
MRKLLERAEPVLRITCLILAAVVVYQLAEIILRWNPFRGVTVPMLPSLSAGANFPADGGPGAKPAASVASMGTGNLPPPPGISTAPIAASVSINFTTAAMPAGKGINAMTNSVLVKAPAMTGTNLLASATTGATGAIPNLNPKTIAVGAGAVPNLAGMNLNPFAPPSRRGADLPPVVQARISRITDSEILGPVMHPLPMALMGIAGQFAFLRSDSGQTGLVKEGDTLDDIKLLRIGINRVLIEQGGQQKELTIFSGYGGESLLSKETPHENNQQ